MWTYNNIRIYPQTYEKNAKQIIARLQPLSTGTIIQTFGYESPIIQMQCKVVGESNLASLVACTTTGTAYALVGPFGVDGVSSSVNLYLASISASRDSTAYQTIDQLQDCEAAVYTVSMELYQ